MTKRARHARETTTVHSVHGLVGLALVNAQPEAVTEVEHLLGPSAPGYRGEPDLRVVFVDSLPRSPEMRYLGLREAAFDAEHFYLLDDYDRRLRINFEELGQPCEIQCETGMNIAPILLSLVGLLLLRRGHVLLHASSLRYQGKGILVTGWTKGGKTELLLAFMAQGAEYLSDEWTIVASEDGMLRGLAAAPTLWGWHFRYVPQYWPRLPFHDRQRLRLIRLYQGLYGHLPQWHARSTPLRLLHRLSLEGGLAAFSITHPPAERLFGSMIRRDPVDLDCLFYGTVSETPIAVLPIDTTEIAARMPASLAFERRSLTAAYQQFRFAFPERRSSLLDDAWNLERTLLERAFAGKTAYELRHPYPVSLTDLFAVAVSVCR